MTIIMTTPFVFAETPIKTRGITPEMAEARQTKASTTIEKLREKERAFREKASSTRANLKEKAETAREKIQEKKTEFKNNFDARKIAILKRAAENTVRILHAAILRLEKIAVRIDSRIAKMEGNKIDVATAKANMIIARQKIADAKNALETAKTTIGEIEISAKNASTTPNIMGESNKKIKEQAKQVKESLKAAHAALVSVIKELKEKEGVAEKHATTTEDTV